MRLRFGSVIAAGALSLMSVAALADRAANGMIVIDDPARPGVFEVFRMSGAGAKDYWCAAGDHAIRGLGLPRDTRIYVAAPVGKSAINPGRSSVTFTVRPSTEVSGAAAAAEQGHAMSVKSVGHSYGASHAQAGCVSSFVVEPGQI
ncbi:hypothetical protein [Tropicimonas sp. IMCC34043]|uniref:hypothetical protein n=1 Tax=Tropicimonas sp. IMCC34043 TaxID=2248760 RepID=UPI0013009B2F|nr:hypothetical protein [Tropicimonas sp. IMCC34043]